MSMQAHEQILADVAESELIDKLVRLMPRRRATGCVVVDDASRAAIVAALGRSADRVGVAAPDVVDVAELARRAGSRRPPAPVVLASLVDEAALVADVSVVDDLDQASVYRLWADLYVNANAHLRGKAKPKFDAFFTRVTDASLDVSGIRTAYGMVCTPRSGSTMLADQLMQLGTCGHPREHLRKGAVTLAEHTDFDLARMARAVMVGDATANGVFGTKVISHFLTPILELQRDGKVDLAPLSGLPLRVVRLRRRDQLAQAFSTHLARASQVYFERNSEKTAQRNAYLRDYEYDYDALVRAHRSLVREEGRLDDVVAASGLPVHDVVFEDVVADPTRELTAIMRFLDVDVPPGFVAPPSKVSKLDDSMSGPIFERFRADFAARH